MRKELFFSVALASMLTCGMCTSCSSSDDNGNGSGSEKVVYNWTSDGGLKACDHILFNNDGAENSLGGFIGNGDQGFVFTGKQTLPKGTYTLKGWVYIANGAELTIEPGTIIKGDKQTKAALIVERGGKLFAQGTASAPIVFTSEEAAGSRKPGDWGGIILCGKSLNNQNEMQIEGGPRTKHGGSDAADNSGVLSYVRIEFAGYPFETDKEINGLTLGSVGSGTKIDHVQVSYSNDDSFEWFGGSVNCNHLVAFKGWDDEFDTDNGFSGKVQFCLSVRDSRIADTSRSNGFESDNDASGDQASPYTTAVFSNVTFIGPRAVDASFANTADYINGGSYNPNNGSSLGLFQSAMHIRRSSRLNCFNSLAIGWPVGIILDNEKGDTQSHIGVEAMLKNIWMADMGILGCDVNKGTKDALYDYTTKTYDETKNSFSHDKFLAEASNRVMETSALMLTGKSSKVGVDYMPQTGSPLVTAASFSDAALSNGFTSVGYIGAFAAGDNWLDGWTEFDPQHAAY